MEDESYKSHSYKSNSQSPLPLSFGLELSFRETFHQCNGLDTGNREKVASFLQGSVPLCPTPSPQLQLSLQTLAS